MYGKESVPKQDHGNENTGKHNDVSAGLPLLHPIPMFSPHACLSFSGEIVPYNEKNAENALFISRNLNIPVNGRDGYGLHQAGYTLFPTH
jgi:hypothetical protein